MSNFKTKSIISILAIGVIYTILKLYVISTPTPNDDQIPDKFLQAATVFAGVGSQ